ncbi:MAG: hypothetical protein ACPG8W_14755 [Candidatus Promineifilaceae bacterium]
MAKVTRKKGKRKRSLSEQVWIVIAILLAISMVLSTMVSLFASAGG